MPYATVRARDQELGPGDRVAFTGDATWLATLWNNHFSNVLEYAHFDDAAHFRSVTWVKEDKWVVVGSSSDARKALDSRPTQWQLVGDAGSHDNTVVSSSASWTSIMRLPATVADCGRSIAAFSAPRGAEASEDRGRIAE